jgi:hypothetical protein
LTGGAARANNGGMVGGYGPAGRTLREDIDAMLLDGCSLEEIERELVDPAPVGEEARAALWLYAWGSLERQRSLVGAA